MFQVEISERRRFFSIVDRTIAEPINVEISESLRFPIPRFFESFTLSRFQKNFSKKTDSNDASFKKRNYVQHVINDRSYRSPERRRTLTNSRSRCPRKLISFRTSERQEQQILRGMRRPVPFRRSLEMTWRGRTSLFSPLLCPTLERVPGFDEMVAGVIEISCSSPGRYDGVHDGPRTVHHPSSSTVPFASVILSTDIRTTCHVRGTRTSGSSQVGADLPSDYKPIISSQILRRGASKPSLLKGSNDSIPCLLTEDIGGNRVAPRFFATIHVRVFPSLFS